MSMATVLEAWRTGAARLPHPAGRAYLHACLEELVAFKPGNVSVHSSGHGMRVADFVAGAEASAGPLSAQGVPLGERILAAVSASVAATGCNTNLGIVLLCAPLLAAAAHPPGGPAALRVRLHRVLAALTVDDTQNVFAAIRIASPGGLGEAPAHDVREPARAPLLEVMRSAAARDRIARQYASGFDDVFDTALPALAAARERLPSRNWQVVALYLALLGQIPDTHVQRKFGVQAAARVQRDARSVGDAVLAGGAGSAALAAVRDFDARLKLGGINPGTTADLTVATLLAERLSGIAVESCDPPVR